MRPWLEGILKRKSLGSIVGVGQPLLTWPPSATHNAESALYSFELLINVSINLGTVA
jgi:hypothetical protein